MSNISSGNSTTVLGENHGYRFEGDFVHINADVNFSEADIESGAAWSLQLLASDNGFAGTELAGVKVAELAIVPMLGGISAAACCNALPPAGAADHVLALALVSLAADGKVQVHDLAIYEATQNFFQPRLVGNVSCTLKEGNAELLIDAIANPRDEDNLSGTLALEVWALDAPYVGGDWAGVPVASMIVGILGGGNEWADCQFNVPAAMPAEGAALTVMLREWTPAGYVTRDYRNFAAAPVKVEAVAKKATAARVKPVAKAKTVAAAKPADAVKGPAAAPKATVKAAEKPVKKEAPKLVSINKASEDELTGLKGLPRDVARAIIAGRPYASLDDVCKAKGMGVKKLAKLRDQLSL
jgi:DNA uptake protein ComE-like DNA-binding protein